MDSRCNAKTIMLIRWAGLPKSAIGRFIFVLPAYQIARNLVLRGPPGLLLTFDGVPFSVKSHVIGLINRAPMLTKSIIDLLAESAKSEGMDALANSPYSHSDAPEFE